MSIKCCEEFEKSTKCSKVNLERVLENDPNDAMTKMLKLFDIYKILMLFENVLQKDKRSAALNRYSKLSIKISTFL